MGLERNHLPMPSFSVRRNGVTLPTVPFTVHLDKRSQDNVLITPDIARYLLANHNGKNRHISEAAVAKYARDMKANRWRDTGERITFDSNGNLVSGQHRLLACIEANTNFTVDIKFGLDPLAREATDTGRSRSAADVFMLMTDDKDYKIKTSTLNSMRKILNPHRDGFSGQLAVQMSKDFARGLDVVVKTIKGKSIWRKSPVMGAFALAATANPNLVRDLLGELLDGQVQTEAAKALLHYAMANFNDETEDVVSAKVLYAIQKHILGEPLERLQGKKKRDGVVEFFLDRIDAANVSLSTLAEIAPKWAATEAPAY